MITDEPRRRSRLGEGTSRPRCGAHRQAPARAYLEDRLIIDVEIASPRVRGDEASSSSRDHCFLLDDADSAQTWFQRHGRPQATNEHAAERQQPPESARPRAGDQLVQHQVVWSSPPRGLGAGKPEGRRPDRPASSEAEEACRPPAVGLAVEDGSLAVTFHHDSDTPKSTPSTRPGLSPAGHRLPRAARNDAEQHRQLELSTKRLKAARRRPGAAAPSSNSH